jgi:maleylpyruvate isomerase
VTARDWMEQGTAKFLAAAAQGRTIQASEIPWLRTREVTVHAVDPGAGVSFADLGDGLNTALVTGLAARRFSAGEAASLAAWLTGRTADPLTPGRWL